MWVLYALLAAFCYALGSLIIKYSVSKVVRDQNGIVVVHAIGALLVILVVWALGDHRLIHSTHDSLVGLTSGVFIGIAAVAYFKALNLHDTSNIVILNQLTVPMTLLLSFIILGDKVTTLQFMAVLLVGVGVVLGTMTRGGIKFKNDRTIVYMLFTTLMWAFSFIATKSILDRHDTITVTLYQTAGYAIFSGLLTIFHPITRSGYLKNMHPFHPKMLSIVWGSEIVFTVAVILQLKAFSFVNAGLATAVGTTEVFMSIILGLALTRFFPHLISEKIDRHTIGRKLAGGAIIVVGIAMLGLNS